jgi:stearoyl-CoA desaturase (Delta-9 desaturase)
MKKFLKRLEWINVAFLTLSPLFAVVGSVYLISNEAIRWPTVIFALGYMAATGLAVTAGYHRLFAHKSYEASGLVKLMMLLLGAAAFENSARLWSSDHRNHHKYVDTDLDPYNIKKGFWYAHIGWILFKRTTLNPHRNIADLDHDPLVRWQHRYYILIAIVMGFGVPALVGGLWHDALGGLILAGFVRVVLNHHFTFLINSLCHYLGGQPYSDRSSARDSWIPALFTYGEGYHNYHHTFPSDYRNGIRLYHWDPTKWFIRVAAWLGQATDLRRMEPEKIDFVKSRMDEKRSLLL